MVNASAQGECARGGESGISSYLVQVGCLPIVTFFFISSSYSSYAYVSNAYNFPHSNGQTAFDAAAVAFISAIYAVPLTY